MSYINILNIPNVHKRQRRMKLNGGRIHGTFKDTNINHYKEYSDLDMQIYGIWLESIDICALRSQYIPIEILDDFYYTHKLEE